MSNRVAVYPGTFDPLTRGHEDLVRRACKLFDHVVVGDCRKPLEAPVVFPGRARDDGARGAGGVPNVEVEGFDGLLMNFLREQRRRVIMRGLRAVSDFEYEFQMAGMNRNLYPDVETVFLTPGDQYMFVSATMVREIATLGGDVSKFVQPQVAGPVGGEVQLTFLRKVSDHGPDYHRRMHQLRRVRAGVPEQRHFAG